MTEQAPSWAVTLQRTLDTVRQQTLAILNRQDDLEGAIVATQADVDALVTRIDGAVADIRGDIEALKAAHPELDLSSLEAKVAGLEGLAAENPVPPQP